MKRPPVLPPKTPIEKPFNPKARYALQLEFEQKDRAILLRIAVAFERIAGALEKMATPPKANRLDVTVTDIPRTEPQAPATS